MSSGKHNNPLPKSVYWLFVAVVVSNAIATYVIIKFFL